MSERWFPFRTRTLLILIIVAAAAALQSRYGVAWRLAGVVNRETPFDGAPPPVYWVHSLIVHPRLAWSAITLLGFAGWRTLRFSH